MGFLHPKKKLIHVADLPAGVRRIALARTVRWFGWGFGEALIPLFILQFSRSFAEAGAFRAAYDASMLLALPIIGMLADRVSAKVLIIVALIFYPWVGVGYFLAGALSLGIFIVVARVINGLTWGLENVGVNTYFRRLSPRTLLGSSFGFIDTWSNFGWIVAAVIGMVLAPHIPTHILLLAVIPTSIIALLVARRVPKDRVRTTKKPRPSLLASYRLLAKEWRHWNKNLWLLSVLVLFTGIIQALMWFFIPIDAYVEGAKPAMVILLSIIAVIPSLFGYTFGKLSDHKNKYVLLAAGLVGVAGVAIGLAVFPAYGFKLIASFLFGVLLELFFVVQQSLVTTLGSSKAYGERGGAFESVATIGDLIGPLVLGFSLDKLGFGNVAICVAVVAVALSSLFLALKHGIVSRA